MKKVARNEKRRRATRGKPQFQQLDLTDAFGVSREVTRGRLTRKRRRGRKVRRKKVRSHSHIRLPLEVEKLLPVHNISW